MLSAFILFSQYRKKFDILTSFFCRVHKFDRAAKFLLLLFIYKPHPEEQTLLRSGGNYS